jgi:hypothetical protein
MFKNDELRKFVAKRVSDAIISFINGSKIDTQNFSSTESSVRVGYLMLAACSDEVANKLFQFICSQDKINNYGETEERKLNFDDSLENLADIAGDRAYTNEGDVEATEFSLADTEEMVIRKSYLTGVNISFQDFHNIARSLENEFAPGQLDVVSSDIRAYTTNYSLSISRDARAFVFFQMFLTILRRMYFEVTTNSFAYDQIRVRHKFNQFFALKLAAKYYDYNLEDFTSAVTNEVNSSTDNLIISSAPQVVNDALMFYNRYFRAMIAKSTAQEQTCLDLVNIVAGHARKIENLRASLKTGINSVKSTLAQNQMSDLESVLNATQLEQAILKKNIVDRYSKSLLGAEYLPAAIDHNVNQSNNLRTAILTNPVLSDPLNNTATRQFYVAIGIPSGLLETLRYNNSNSSTDEHLFSIDLIFRNLQRTELQEAVETQTGRTTPGATPGTDRDTEIGFASKSYTFSTRIFVREGSREDGGPDVTSSQLTSYPQIATSSKFKILDDDGNYTDVDYSTLDRILGSQVVINNHLLSHYGKLYLKSVSGINLDEEIFDIVPQERTYPDVNKLSAYSTLEDLSANIFGATAEDQLNRVRLLQDLARSRQLAPQQHKLSMMVSKTFERIHVIPVDLTEILSSPGINLPDADIAFIDVVAKIRLLDDQIPVTRGARSSDRSFVNSLGASGDGRVEPVNLSQFSASSQSVASVGISNIVETSNRFGGRLGGYSR